MKHIFTGSLLLLSSSLYAAAISGVEHGSAAGGYQLVFKNAGVKPTAFNTDSSIVLDFPNTTSSMKSRGVDVASNGIYNADVIPGQGRTRAPKGALAVKTPAAPAAGFRGAVNPQMVTVGKGTATIGKGVNSASALAPEFRRTSNGRAAFTFNLPSPDTVVNVRKDGNKVIADVRGITISNSEQKRLDVTDYNTPVSYAEIKKGNGGATVSLNMAGNPFEFVSYQSGNTYTIEVMKPAQNAQDRKVQEMLGFGSGKHYKGEPLSLNFQDIEVRAVLQIIAEFTHNNIVVSDGVTGNITLRLDNVPWDQALDIIMKTKGLDKRQSGDVI